MPLTLLVPKLTGTGIVRHFLFGPFFTLTVRTECHAPAKDTITLAVGLQWFPEPWNLLLTLIWI